MNNTTKATYDAAKRMIKGGIELEEVSMLLDIPVEKLKPIKDEVDEDIRKVYGNLDNYDFTKEQYIFDDFNDTGIDADLPEDMDEEL